MSDDADAVPTDGGESDSSVDGESDSSIEVYDKLVRDRIPEVIRENGDVPETHVADGAAFRRRLAEKLVEESVEFNESGDVEELADVLAVVNALCDVSGVDRTELERIERRKADERGGFEERIVLDRVRTE